MLIRSVERVAVWHAVGIASMVLVLVAPVLALECPKPQPLSRPGILKETRTQTQVGATLLATGDADNA